MIIVRSQISEHIEIKTYQEESVAYAELALAKLFSKPNGRALLDKINSLSNQERFVTLEVVRTNTRARPVLTKSQLTRFKIKDYDLDINSRKALEISKQHGNDKGEGVSAVVYWNPEDAHEIKDGGIPERVKNRELGFVGLAHELVHASRYLEGVHQHDGKNIFPGNGNFLEEERATGIGRFSNERLSENGIRAEHGLKIRKSYYGMS